MNPTAVSTSPSLPPIVWKKNSVADNPVKKESLTKPLACIKSNITVQNVGQQQTVMHYEGENKKHMFTTMWRQTIK
jgi:hypothetical protein